MFPDFAPRHIYEYAYVTKSLQLLVSLWFSAPRYGFYCTICVKKTMKTFPIVLIIGPVSY
jgi:hypothetical protein